jgi:hypothetical protein
MVSNYGSIGELQRILAGIGHGVFEVLNSICLKQLRKWTEIFSDQNSQCPYQNLYRVQTV